MVDVTPVVRDLIESMNKNNVPISMLDCIVKRARIHIETTTVPYFSKDDSSVSFAMCTSSSKETRPI